MQQHSWIFHRIHLVCLSSNDDAPQAVFQYEDDDEEYLKLLNWLRSYSIDQDFRNGCVHENLPFSIALLQISFCLPSWCGFDGPRWWTEPQLVARSKLQQRSAEMWCGKAPDFRNSFCRGTLIMNFYTVQLFDRGTLFLFIRNSPNPGDGLCDFSFPPPQSAPHPSFPYNRHVNRSADPKHLYAMSFAAGFLKSVLVHKTLRPINILGLTFNQEAGNKFEADRKFFIISLSCFISCKHTCTHI